MKLGVFIIITSILTSCDLIENEKIPKEDLDYILSFDNCDSLMNDTIFKTYSQMEWPDENPENLVEAVLMLDEMTNECTDHFLKICDGVDLHFGFGMSIRNKWVYHGSKKFNRHITRDLGISHADNVSGIILGLYTLYKSDKQINIVDDINNEHFHPDTLRRIKSEFMKVQNELNDLKN